MAKILKYLIIGLLFIFIPGCQPKQIELTPSPVINKTPTVKSEVSPLKFASIPMDNRLKMLEGWTML